jgi:hypothetical protein
MKKHDKKRSSLPLAVADSGRVRMGNSSVAAADHGRGDKLGPALTKDFGRGDKLGPALTKK